MTLSTRSLTLRVAAFKCARLTPDADATRTDATLTPLVGQFTITPARQSRTLDYYHATLQQLTRDTYLGALAETQAHHNRALQDNNKTMINIWEREVARIELVLENWDTLSTEYSDA